MRILLEIVNQICFQMSTPKWDLQVNGGPTEYAHHYLSTGNYKDL